MLILHGTSDSRVPLAEARRLEATLRELGQSPEFHVYPGQGHILDWASYADVVRRGTVFLTENLR